MLPRILTAVEPEENRKRYKVVLLSTFADVPGMILTANADSGLCLLREKTGGSAERNFGPQAIAIVPRGPRDGLY